VPPRGEARSDLAVIFDLAVRLGLGGQFFNGDVEAAWNYQLEPSGVTVDQLRKNPRHDQPS
jgi:anaerobic selenocysteine-containing dehydrogenase